MRPETIKIIEENLGDKHVDIGLYIIFWICLFGQGRHKEKINKWGYIKLKRFYTEKGTINQRKRHPTEWEKVYTKDTARKCLTPKIYT